MLRGVALRLLQAIPVVVIFAVLVFTLLHLLPGDPAVAIAGSEATPEAIERIRQQLGLDRPVLEQLGSWFGRLAQGDFGKSLILNQSVLSAVVERLPVTLSLSFLSLTITIPAGITLGVLAAYWRNTWLDSLVMMSALVGVSMPSFWLGILSVIFFSVTLGWLPPAGYTPISQGLWPWLSALIQPAVVLALFQIGFLARITRSAMLDVLDQDFIRTARAKGVDEWKTISKHAFRNTLIPVVTVSRNHSQPPDWRLGGRRAGFALPGIGRLIVQGILARDYPLVQGTMLIFGFSFVVINILVDIIYMTVDPRVRFG